MNTKAVIVNTLTFSRVPLIIAWLILAVVEDYFYSPWLIFLAALCMFLSGVTDALDGMLARKWNVVSPLGKMADPLMDKVFYVVTFPALAWLLLRQGSTETIHSFVMLVFAILYILRDLWVTFLRSVGSLYGADGAAMWLGKVRTALSFPTAGWVYCYLAFHDLPFFAPAKEYMLWSCYIIEVLMISLNLISSWTYTRAYYPYIKKALERA